MLIQLRYETFNNIRRLVIAPEDKRFGNRGRDNKDKAIMNERIRSAEVRLIDQNGDNHGVVATSKALAMAEEIGFGFIAVAIVSDILILCKSFSGPVLAGE